VRFFETAAEAERAGFRPCKRCKPGAAPLGERRAAAIVEACELIGKAEEKPDFAAIAAAIEMSRHHFHRQFKEIVGVTPGAYWKSLRERRVMQELQQGKSVTDAIYGAGYGSSSRFYENFAQKLGLKPSAFTSGGAGETILFALGECSLGSILVAATEKGVCAIEFGDEPQALIESFQDRFPNAELVGGDEVFERIVAEVIGFVETPGQDLTLPLHVRGTAFQHRVWRILCEIPPGKTLSYTEVAAKAGNPSAVRAVANACASNKIAVAIPCHRVVRTGGAISGYRWGVERKAELLKREAER
jgi:AraC family transcriptional regulator of adaptative response/methylated-DNA-[protein]-cysteine methyltransferase